MWPLQVGLNTRLGYRLCNTRHKPSVPLTDNRHPAVVECLQLFPPLTSVLVSSLLPPQIRSCFWLTFAAVTVPVWEAEAGRRQLPHSSALGDHRNSLRLFLHLASQCVSTPSFSEGDAEDCVCVYVCVCVCDCLKKPIIRQHSTKNLRVKSQFLDIYSGAGSYTLDSHSSFPVHHFPNLLPVTSCSLRRDETHRFLLRTL